MSEAMSIGPIRPEDVREVKSSLIPPVVFEVINFLIVQNYLEGTAVVRQEVILSMLADRGVPRSEVFNNCWLDVEDLYRAQGWLVEYDKPAYCEAGILRNIMDMLRMRGKK